MPEDITPIRQQYLDIKKQYPDTIVFFRLGDFYETFDQDAEIASRELDIVLTSRNVAKGVRVPLAGIPYHAVENYLSRLIRKGYHVAICEQVGDQPAKGLFPREVVRVVTPGTLIEPALLPGDRNNYLLSYLIGERKAALAYVDISTGEFLTLEYHSNDPINILRSEINRISPSELLLPEGFVPLEGIDIPVTKWPVWRFELGRCQTWLMDVFHTATLEGFGLKGMDLATQTSGAILQYIKETHPDALKQIRQIKTYSLDDFMVLDSPTRRNLELTETIRTGSKEGTLLGVLDKTITPMGHRLVAAWVNKPLLSLQEIRRRQDGIRLFFEQGLLRAEVRDLFKRMADLERLNSRVQMGLVQPRELISLKMAFLVLPELIKRLAPHQQSIRLNGSLVAFDKLVDLLSKAIVDDPPATLNSTGIIKPGFSSELDSIIEASRHAREWIANLETVEKNRTGIKTLKVGYNKVFGYYIEISRGSAGQAPPDYIRKQTLVNAERFITPELKEYETLVMNAEERIHEIELRIYKEVCSEIAQKSNEILDCVAAVTEVDVFAALAEVAVHHRYVCPIVDESTDLEIIEGRHPVVENSLKSEKFIPNDIVFENGELIRIITGPNMSGKSTYLRQAALIVLMAQMGSFVPARSARIGLVDRIFTRIGAQDEIHSGQSTFMVEMVETSNILHHATPRSLLVLDEIGRGTSTYDGISIAWAVIEYIHNHPDMRSRTFFATHYHELIQLSDIFPGIRNYNVAVTEDNEKVVFLHRIIPGGADQSYGIHVAQLAGMPSSVVARSKQILLEMEAASGLQYRNNPLAAQQIALFPETNPLIDELKGIDINTLTPIEALNKLFEWKNKFLS